MKLYYVFERATMDKGIRPACNAKFLELLPQRAVLGNTAFRKAVMDSIQEDFGCTLAASATHYNHAFKEARKTNNPLLEGLGRAEDKKGGRKKKVKADAPVAAPVLLLTYTPAAQPAETFTVKRKKDGEIVAEGLTFEQAREAVDKAKAAKKAALYWI